MECDSTKVGAWDCFRQCFNAQKCREMSLLSKNNRERLRERLREFEKKHCLQVGQAYLSSELLNLLLCLTAFLGRESEALGGASINAEYPKCSGVA